MRLLIFIMLATLLGGCAMQSNGDAMVSSPAEPQSAPMEDRLGGVPELDGEIITVAVYDFSDKTGQRKPNDNIANLSTAVTQGAEVWVIKALQDIGNGTWFDVVERVGLDNLVKERQLIRNTREVYAGSETSQLKPMRFAGLILEGGIVGYDSNIITGGAGARFLGIGAQTEYRLDNVTVVMRLVSVNSGRVLLSVATQKSIASTRSSSNVFRFLDMGTQAIEAEVGYSVNEPVNYAVRAAIEAGIIELIYQGHHEKLWEFREREDNEKNNSSNMFDSS